MPYLTNKDPTLRNPDPRAALIETLMAHPPIFDPATQQQPYQGPGAQSMGPASQTYPPPGMGNVPLQSQPGTLPPNNDDVRGRTPTHVRDRDNPWARAYALGRLRAAVKSGALPRFMPEWMEDPTAAWRGVSKLMAQSGWFNPGAATPRGRV